ncbi:MAG: DUF3179 domain-containing protein [Flavobacteriales bacterium]|nr:DUF3179 domain-containing protein [Flavobacteriales bacterium]
MNMKVNRIIPSLLMMIFVLVLSCKKDESLNEETIWAVPKDEVKDGGPGKDGIPAIDEPKFVSSSEATHIENDELVIAIKIGSEVKVYPHTILDRHEIVNDVVSDEPLSIIYCPLTGTATAWSRIVDGQTTTFGVSGLLYNSNVIPYDRATNSNWSQLRLDCINGDLLGTLSSNFHIVETTWATIKSAYPDLKALSEDTGFDRNYDVYPYGDYKTNHSNIIFPVSGEDNRNDAKDRVLSIIKNGKVRSYEIDNFSDNTELLQESYEGEELVILGSKTKNFAVAYSREIDGTILDFTALDDFPVVMTDAQGNKWNLFGECVEGDRAGQRLNSPQNIIGYWFSFAAFYPGLEIGK